MSKFNKFLEVALPAYNAKRTAEDLGDRSTYVGASDIAGCPRKAVQARLNPKPFTIQELLRFERGHAAEGMFAEIFASANTAVARKVEIIHPEEPGLKSHPDFVFYSKRRKYLHVVEFKSTDGIPDKPYSSWVDQLHFQMGCIEAHLKKHGELRLIIRGEEVAVPADTVIGGSIVAIDLNEGTHHEFNSYEPSEIIFKHLSDKGLRILSAFKGGPMPEPEPSALCGCCKYRSDCPSHGQCAAGEMPEEAMLAVVAYDNFMKSRDRLDVHIKDMREVILSHCEKGRFEGYTQESQLLEVVSTHVADSTYVDEFRLKIRHPDAYKDCAKKKRAHTRLMVKVQDIKQERQVPLKLKAA